MEFNGLLINKYIWHCVVLITASILFSFSQNGEEPQNHYTTVAIRDDGTFVFRNESDLGGKILYQFGMPQSAAKKKWIAEDKTYNLEWEQGGIKYTMSVFPVISPFSTNLNYAMLFVRLHGENTDSEYREAKAGFAVKTNEMDAKFNLKEGFVFLSDKISAFIDIPAGCVVEENGGGLKFSGNMPPGTTGAMVFKIPIKPLDRDIETKWFVDLEYADALEKFKKIDQSSNAVYKALYNSIKWYSK
ncbi:MAG: hypothetical protein ACP5T0_01760 [Verrucomicrobiia bacterium]